jgi:cobalt/nickel transport system permease protein
LHLPHIDKYAHISSFFSSWDARAKILSLSLLIFSIALVDEHLSALFGLIISTTLLLLSRIPFAFVVKQLRWVIFFVSFFLIVISLTAPGERVYFLSLYGLRLGTLVAMRAFSICILLFLIAGTTKFHTNLKALSRLKIPNKIVQLLMFTYRYIFVFVEEARKMFISAKARLFGKRMDIFTLKIIGNLLGMLFIRGFEMTQNIYNAMISRGYKGSLKTHDEFKFSFLDLLKTSLIIGVAVLLRLV